MILYGIILISSTLLSQEWEIDTTSSYIKYQGEHPLHSWEGISKNIKFKLNCQNNFCNLDISTPLESFNSGNDSRDSNMLYYTESLIHPNVSFKSNKFKFSGDFDNSIDITGTIHLHGIKKELPIKINLLKENNLYVGTCKFNINLSEFEIEKPSLLMIKISDRIDVETKFNLIQKKE